MVARGQPEPDATRWRIDNEDGFLACYDATVREAYRYAHRLTGSQIGAGDVVQDVFVGLLRAAGDGSLTEIGLGRIMVAVRHRVIDQVRARDCEARRLRLAWSRPADGADLDRELVDLGPLPDRERVALTLRYVDDLSVADVAAELRATVRATESLLARARARVRKADR